jgi:hypothetical protein
MATDNSKNPPRARRNDGQRFVNRTDGAVKPPKPGRKKNAAPKEKSEESATLPAFAPPTAGHWHWMISEAAYYRAEKRGFVAGYSLDDWLIAEAEIKRMHAT